MPVIKRTSLLSHISCSLKIHSNSTRGVAKGIVESSLVVKITCACNSLRLVYIPKFTKLFSFFICRHPRPVLKFNQFDDECNVDRRSYHGLYKVVDGLSL